MPSELTSFIIGHITQGWRPEGGDVPIDATYWSCHEHDDLTTLEIYDTRRPDKYGRPNLAIYFEENDLIELMHFSKCEVEHLRSDISNTYDPRDPQFMSDIDNMRRAIIETYPSLLAEPCES